MKGRKLSECWKTLCYCMRLSWEASRLYTALRVCCELFVPLLGIVSAYLGKYLLDLLAGSFVTDERQQALLFFLGAVLLVKLLESIAGKGQQYMQMVHNELLGEKISLMLMRCSTGIDMEYFDNTEYYDKLRSAANDANAITQVLWNVLTFVGQCVSFLSVFAVLWLAKPVYGILLLAAAVPHAAVSVWYTKNLYHFSLDQINAERRKGYLQGICMEKAYAQDIRLFDTGDLLREKYHVIWREVFEKRRTLVRSRTLFMILAACLPELVSFGIAVDIGRNVLAGAGSVGDYSLYTGLAVQLISSCSLLAYTFSSIYDNKLRIENFKRVFEFENHVPDTGTRGLAEVEKIEFSHVSFRYPGTNGRALSDVSFCLYKGEKTAFVGINGAGKSTLIKLLLRMYEPEEGCIRINDIPIGEYRLKELRNCFSVYFQEMRNYSMSVYENVTMSDLEREKAEGEQAVYQALAAGCCDDILKKTKKGLGTNLTRVFDAEGMELSGGQSQKIALARCLFRRRPVLVLDEPSSNLDPEAEHDIFENLKILTDGKLTIFTSHRLSNVFLADKIIVLENGQIVEMGTQRQLLENKNRYAELFRYQSEKFVQEGCGQNDSGCGN